VKEYTREVLGNSDGANKFADEFIKRKKAGKSSGAPPQQTQQQAKPKQSPAQSQPQQQQTQTQNQQSQQALQAQQNAANLAAQKKKKKMQKLPAELLGFTTTLSGEIETLDD